MSYQMTSSGVAELLEEAAGARTLAALFGDAATVRDLLNYAVELEAHASRLLEYSPVWTRA